MAHRRQAWLDGRVRVLLVDDHAIVRRGLRDVVRELHPDAMFDEADTAAAALALVSSRSWDLAIVDLSLPQRGGLDLLHDLHAHQSDLPVLIVSMHSEREYVVRAFRAGAAGYIPKTAAAEELPTAIRVVLDGHRYLQPALASDIVAELAGPVADPVSALSDRELQVLRMIGAGKSVKQISNELSLSEKTISTYRTRLLAKLGFARTAELMRFAIERGLA